MRRTSIKLMWFLLSLCIVLTHQKNIYEGSLRAINSQEDQEIGNLLISQGLEEAKGLVDLGFGSANFNPPDFLLKALNETVNTQNYQLHQYTRSHGWEKLVNATANLFGQLINRKIDPNEEVLITIGGTEALFAAVLGHINPGDEVILIEPHYYLYPQIVHMAEGIPIYLTLKPPANFTKGHSNEWHLDMNELESKFSNKTKMIIVNTPHNPLGKTLSRDELISIGNLAVKYDCIILMDEVYQFMTFRNQTHERIASFPQFWNRTISVGSLSKSFFATGWRLGWAYGCKELLRPMGLIHEVNVDSVAPFIQETVAKIFETEIQRLYQRNSFFKQLTNTLEDMQNKTLKILDDVNINYVYGEATPYLLINIKEFVKCMDPPPNPNKPLDIQVTNWFVKNKLNVIPMKIFCSGPNSRSICENWVRICNMRTNETLDAAHRVLIEIKNQCKN